MREAKSFDIFLLVVLGVIWGSSFFNIKIASFSYEPFTLGLVRVFFASLPLLILCKYKAIKIKAFTKEWKDYALIGLCNIAIPFTLIAIGTSKINSYLAAMLMSTTPLSGSILAHFFTKNEKITFPVKENSGKVFGSITSIAIYEKLSELGYEISRKNIDLKKPINTLGESEVKIKLYNNISTTIKVEVVPL